MKTSQDKPATPCDMKNKLVDFDWSITYSLGSDKIANIEEPLMRLSMITSEESVESESNSDHPKISGKSNTKMFELDKNDLTRLISDLENIESKLENIDRSS